MPGPRSAPRHGLLVARDIPLTVVTNSLTTAQICGAAAAVRVIVIGGMLRTGSATLWGEPGRRFLTTVKADLCLLGAHAISDALVTESSLEGGGDQAGPDGRRPPHHSSRR